MEYVISELGGTGPSLGWQVLAVEVVAFVLLPVVISCLSFWLLSWWFKPRQLKTEPH